MKKTNICALYRRSWFALIVGRIRSIDAPVVPKRFADSVPKARIAVLVAGVPTRLPLTRIPAGGHEEGEEQNDERQIVEQEGVEDFRGGGPEAEEDGARDEQGKRPEGGHLAEMTLPEMRRQQRQKSDGEEQARERDRPGEACASAVEMRGRCRRDATFRQATPKAENRG